MEELWSTNNLNELNPIGDEYAQNAEDEAKEKQDELVADCNEMIASMQDAYDETINELQDTIEYYSVYANDPQNFEEYDSEPVTVEVEEEEETEEEEEQDEMFVRTKSHMGKCWGFLFGVTFLFAGASILVLTKLKDEQR